MILVVLFCGGLACGDDSDPGPYVEAVIESGSCGLDLAGGSVLVFLERAQISADDIIYGEVGLYAVFASRSADGLPVNIQKGDIGPVPAGLARLTALASPPLIDSIGGIECHASPGPVCYGDSGEFRFDEDGRAVGIRVALTETATSCDRP